jgi:hypothetical protein
MSVCRHLLVSEQAIPRLDGGWREHRLRCCIASAASAGHRSASAVRRRRCLELPLRDRRRRHALIAGGELGQVARAGWQRRLLEERMLHGDDSNSHRDDASRTRHIITSNSNHSHHHHHRHQQPGGQQDSNSTARTTATRTRATTTALPHRECVRCGDSLSGVGTQHLLEQLQPAVAEPETAEGP